MKNTKLLNRDTFVIGYTLLLTLIKFKTLVMRGDLERASAILPSIPKDRHNSVALFLESRGMIEEALEVATDPDYRFDLSIHLGKLEIAKDIALVAQSESKWKQLGELAMSNGLLDMAEDCLKHANDITGLLLLYSSLGDAEGIIKLASLAKENGKNNVTFACLFMLGKLEDCLQLLVDSNRIHAAALMARSYLPNKVSEIVALWRKDLNKVNQKAAKSLFDTEEYSNMFEDWQIAPEVEARAAETRFHPKHHNILGLPTQLPDGADAPSHTECNNVESRYPRLDVPGSEYKPLKEEEKDTSSPTASQNNQKSQESFLGTLKKRYIVGG